ncbi:MAG: type II toxin-antitoxin system HicA family toxin [Patescibacteria group bacterium]
MSERTPTFSSKDLIRALLQLGFLITPGGKGSHTKLTHPTARGALTIPKSKSLGIGIRTALLKQIERMGTDRTDLLDQL